ncbi:hypothetical protein Fmac_000165 [Flemingia macrophylla]|uniref:PPM-type phosphatase domain-containing protein n=1 Tax=Flemingia macrophylla TaxID=520843 RepID=A0ABD1NDH8_9FABA
MPVGMDFSPLLEDKEGAFVVEDEQLGDSDNLRPMTKGKPPRHGSGMRHSVSAARLMAVPDLSSDVGVTGSKSSSEEKTEFLPIFRSGSCAEIGPKQYMEDEHVFDGHGGTDAALFIRNNILRTMIVANAGDCRAVLGRRGRAVEMSTDQKPNCISERLRIETLGGVVYDGYLNGQLSVSRALGDWHMKGPKGSACPLSAEPELQEINLTEDDEFLIMGCDGLWDVMSNQCAVTMARKELMIHNDPQRCSRELVREALKRNSCDNLTVIVICFSPDPPPRIETPPSRVRRSISAEGLNLLKGVLDC